MLVLRPIHFVTKQQSNSQQPHSATEDQHTPLVEDGREVHTISSHAIEQSSWLDPEATDKDLAITIHTCVFVLALGSSCLSDDVATFLQSNMSVHYMIAFCIFDLVENIFYIVGFAALAIGYRIIAIHIWRLQEQVEHALENFDQQQGNHNLKSLLSTIRSTYEIVFETMEELNGKTGGVVVVLVALASMEMASTLHDVFAENDHVDWTDITHLAIFRLLIVVGSLILQVGLAAADVMYASERLAEALARLESILRIQIATYGSTTQEPDCAQACKALGDRIRNHPARVRFSWFHLTTEWALGVTLLVFALVLAVFGIELPGGE